MVIAYWPLRLIFKTNKQKLAVWQMNHNRMELFLSPERKLLKTDGGPRPGCPLDPSLMEKKEGIIELD